MKGRLRAAVEKIGHAAAVITDWLLIGSGLLLFFVAVVRIDVPLAKWFLLGCGLFLAARAAGFGSGGKKTLQNETVEYDRSYAVEIRRSTITASCLLTALIVS